jgi:vanillate O-demethylase monooxygenase subunit
MDLTHETFVHGASIGQRSIAEVPFEVTHGPRSATVTRWMENVEPPPFWRMQLEWRHGRPAGNVDRWQIIHFEPPSTIAIDVGVAPTGTGAPDGDRSQGVNGYVLNTMTPETERTCHYFWAFVRNYKLDDQRITTLIRDGVSGVFAEDEDVLAAQQRGVESHPDKQFYNLNIDGGAMWARRLIDTMLAEESADERYAASASEATAQEGTSTRVEATEADAERLGVG